MALFLRSIVFLLGILTASTTFASPIYVIDSAQSYVSAYVPIWTAYSYTPFYVPGPDGAPPPASTVVWDLTWSLQKFGLSGNFEGTSDLSPWEPPWAHLTITNASILNSLPSYINNATSVLPTLITYSQTDATVADPGPCLMDPYYPPTSVTCFYTTLP